MPRVLKFAGYVLGMIQAPVYLRAPVEFPWRQEPPETLGMFMIVRMNKK